MEEACEKFSDVQLILQKKKKKKKKKKFKIKINEIFLTN